MKKFKDSNNEIWNLPIIDFDEKGNVINEITKEIIEKNKLIAITDKEYEVMINYKSSEQIAEEERLAKLPSEEEILNDKITLKALEIIAELELI